MDLLDESVIHIFARMTGKFLQKNFLNLAEADRNDLLKLFPEVIRVERLLYDTYKQKATTAGLLGLNELANDPNIHNHLYAFVESFMALRTFRYAIDPSTDALNEQQDLVSAIADIGTIQKNSWEIILMDAAYYSLVRAAMQAEGVVDNLEEQSFRIVGASDSLPYSERSRQAIRTAKANAVLLQKHVPDLFKPGTYESISQIQDLNGIANNSQTPVEAIQKAEELAMLYLSLDTPRIRSLCRSTDHIPSVLMDTNADKVINFSDIPEFREIRKIENLQERLLQTISLLSLTPSDGHFQVRYQGINACNIYSTDVLQAMLGNDVISHRVSSTGNPVIEGGRELNAAGMFHWMQNNGQDYGWENVTSLSFEEKNELLAAGFIFFGATEGHNWVIGMAEGAPVLSQATFDVPICYASPYSYKITGQETSKAPWKTIIYAHRIPNFS